MPKGRVLGVDACKAGWVGVALSDARTQAYVATDITTLVSLAAEDGDLMAVAIDMPIGLPDHSLRQADLLARAAVGPLRSSVFMTPVRQALLAGNHASADAVNRHLTGKGVSTQAFGLKTKLLEVDAFAQEGGHRIIEVHPEVRGSPPRSTREVQRRSAQCHLGLAIERTNPT